MVHEYLAVLYNSKDEQDHKFELVRELLDGELLKYEKAAQELREWFGSDQYDLLEHSYKQYFEILIFMQEQYKTKPVPDSDAVKLNLNFALLNFLCMMRLYLDHAQTQINRLQEPNKTEELTAYKAVVKKEFDTAFAYRFASSLRNYAQHCGFPIDDFEVNSEFTGESNKNNTKLEVYFNKDFLLNSYDKWKPIIKDDFKKLPAKFPVDEFIKDLMKCLRRIQAEMTLHAQSRLSNQISLILGLIEETRTKSGEPLIMKINVQETQPAPKLTLIKFPVRQLHLLGCNIPV